MSTFQGAANITIHSGIFTAVSNTVAGAGAPHGIVTLLLSHSATAGLLDAAERFDAPKCDEGTRISMLRRMKNFVQDGNSYSSPALFWLHGPAGVGKSALAQSLSLLLKGESDHAASFFFARTSLGRNNGNQLITTLAYQLAINFPALQPFISESVKENPAVFTSSNTTQMQSLIIDPINQWQQKHRRSFRRWAYKVLNINKKVHPRLILVDGLDECNDPEVQRDLIACIGLAIRQLPLPFRFVIASRPESHILAMFELDPVFQQPGGIKVISINLGDDENADEQITTFLLKEFAEIRRTHPIRDFLPQPWPQAGQISRLVSKSSKGFIYPVTVIRYIRVPRNRPDECLERILGLLEVPTHDKPYEPLDRLYRHIFESIPDINKHAIRKIFHLLVIPGAFDGYMTPQIIERCLHFKPGHVRHILQDLLCIVSFTTFQEPIKVLHASLPDFLLDRSRSGSLYIDIADAHALVAAGFYEVYGHGFGLGTRLFPQFLNHLFLANITQDLMYLLSEADLGKEYMAICEVSIGCKSTEPRSDQLAAVLKCASFIVAYLYTLVIKGVPRVFITSQIYAIQAHVVQTSSFGSHLCSVQDEIIHHGSIIPSLRRCLAMDHGCISKIFASHVIHSEIGRAIDKVHILLMAPLYDTSPRAMNIYGPLYDTLEAELTGLSLGYPRIVYGLLVFLIRWHYFGPKVQVQDILLLAVELVAASLGHVNYSASLITVLGVFINTPFSLWPPSENELMSLCVQKLAPTVVSYLDRARLQSPTGYQMGLEHLDSMWRRELGQENASL